MDTGNASEFKGDDRIAKRVLDYNRRWVIILLKHIKT